MKWATFAGLIVVALFLVSCGGDRDLEGTVINMHDNRFSQQVVRIPVGGVVTFRNAGRAPHNAVALDGSWSTEEIFGSLSMANGDTASLQFNEPGTFQFFCTFHSIQGKGMVATLVVGDAAFASEEAKASDVPAEWTRNTKEVPAAYPNIQSAVDAADPGDLILVSPGIYREQVNVTTPSLTIRGTDRNNVIIDGEFQRENGINVVGADGVAVENVTVRNALGNGLFWTGVTGFRASYVTSIDNAVYGIYAFDSSDGLFEHSYASGSYDAGVYVGQCDPCRTVLTDLLIEWNGLGYSGTNASGDLYIINSVWRYNISGIVPNTLDSELLPPFHDVTIMGNLIHDNGNTAAPVKEAEWTTLGNGVLLAGGNNSLVARNRIANHSSNGIVIIPNLDKNFWFSSGNGVRENVIEGSARADLALGGPAGDENCFENNTFTSSLPVGIEVFQGCEGLRLPWRFELATTYEPLSRIAEASTGGMPDNPVGSAPRPGPQPQMPGGTGAPVRPAVNVFDSYPLDLESITLPDLPVEVTIKKGPTVFGVLLSTGGWAIFFGLWTYLMPFMLFGALLAIALWDLVRRNLGRTATVIWVAILLLIPFLGIIAYFVVGKSSIPAWQRATIVGGGIGSYLILFVIGALVGGIV